MKDQEHDLIDRFLTGDLSEEEDQKFRKKLQSKPFSKAVDLQARLKRRLTAERAASPLGRLLEAEAKRMPPLQPGIIARRTTMIISSVAAVFLLIATAIWWSDINYGDEAIIARFHQPIYDDTQAGVPNAEDLLDEAKRAFFREDYARAELLSANITRRDSAYFQSAQALKVYALFNQKKYAPTIEQVNLLLAEQPLGFDFPEGGADKLRWTRLLAYVGTNAENSSAFRSELSFFLNGLNESYRNRARELKNSLDSGWRSITL